MTFPCTPLTFTLAYFIQCLTLNQELANWNLINLYSMFQLHHKLLASPCTASPCHTLGVGGDYWLHGIGSRKKRLYSLGLQGREVSRVKRPLDVPSSGPQLAGPPDKCYLISGTTEPILLSHQAAGWWIAIVPLCLLLCSYDWKAPADHWSGPEEGPGSTVFFLHAQLKEGIMLGLLNASKGLDDLSKEHWLYDGISSWFWHQCNTFWFSCVGLRKWFSSAPSPSSMSFHSI